ncbi:hypothetical protein L228DRAFT_236348 [Xylona heveae TC161]|uniref:Zn(2)-C6 fungal-type domain-containing protein n=1 Tax=Xylona heveae (strain CBS 132557 / TC161) TaxID=1328760 RepID=A0A165IQA2_XYLHT|nr:hypothetical protein L228DRAFT_236348 [Xylona heveae TC161]KZF25226.1 hypothetical protein L228DRAFT_236348 [Xylona heveae TC161]
MAEPNHPPQDHSAPAVTEQIGWDQPQTQFADTSQPQGRQRLILACLSCRRRKVRCDHGYPTCAACRRGNHVCQYPTSRTPGQGIPNTPPTRVMKPPPVTNLQHASQAEVNVRLERLERLLETTLQYIAPQPTPLDSLGGEPELAPSSVSNVENIGSTVGGNEGSAGRQLYYDGRDGALILENGQSHFVSARHWALLAGEIQDIKGLLGGQTEGVDAIDVSNNGESIADSSAHQYGHDSLSSSFPIFGTDGVYEDLTPWVPNSREDCYLLLGIFLANVDPMLRLIHKPTFTRKFDAFVKGLSRQPRRSSHGHTPDDRGKGLTGCDPFEPLVLAVFFAAVNSMKTQEVFEKFSIEKGVLLEKFKQGTELALKREKLLTTRSIEVLQAFVILLTSQCREDDMNAIWPLSGLAIRIALSQGLHRDPVLFNSNSLDAIQVELRRRLWHQICQLDYRSAEGTGQEPTISDDDFDTLFPANINDDDLTEGASPSTLTQNSERFTDMTIYLVRLTGAHCFRKLMQSTKWLERDSRAFRNAETSDPHSLLEQQTLFENMRKMVGELLENVQRLYLRHCDPRVLMQKMTLGYANLLEWKFWIIFWLRLPAAYREATISLDVRTTMFTKSLNLMGSLVEASSNKDCEPFQWHIRSHSAFQAILYALSELRSPSFQGPEQAALRARGIRTLKAMKEVKGSNSGTAWTVVKRLIDTLPNQNLPYLPNRGESMSQRSFANENGMTFPLRDSLLCSSTPPMSLGTLDPPSRLSHVDGADQEWDLSMANIGFEELSTASDLVGSILCQILILDGAFL